MADKIKILYIDDEEANLLGFKASFRLNYKILIAQNTADALVHLNANPDIRIIFCDQRMPDKTGVQFFEEIRNDFPLPIRILITGYTDIQSVIDAINLGNIFRYVKKPWVENDIESAINEANRYYTTTSLLTVKNNELQKAYEELDKFSYSVTHDIRRPLLSILGAIDVASQTDNIKDVQNLLEMMKESVTNLDTFIQSLHDYYNINRGQLQLEEIDFNDLIKDLNEKYSLIAAVEKIDFTTKVTQPNSFRTDRFSLKIILNNLVSNAFKYQKRNNENKCVELDINVQAAFAIIRIKDNGIGIQEQHQKDIFNLFFRATSEEVGSGFGLYTVKDALLKLNGEIKVDSVPGQGSSFTVIIPNK